MSLSLEISQIKQFKKIHHLAGMNYLKNMLPSGHERNEKQFQNEVRTGTIGGK